MGASLLDIARTMDCVAPPESIKELLNRHRWRTPAPPEDPPTQPPSPASLLSMARRHTHPQSLKLRFLVYNTYLLRVDVPLAEYIQEALDLARLLEFFGIHPEDALQEALKHGFSLCDLLPSAPGPFPGPREACKLLGGGATAVIEFVLNRLDGIDTPIELLEALGVDPVSIAGWFGIDVPAVTVTEKPELLGRSQEIGEMIGEHYDLAALSEVWTDDLRSRLLSGFSDPPTVHVGPGPSGDWVVLGSGLLVTGAKRPQHDGPSHVYSIKGDTHDLGSGVSRLIDIEHWSNKGVTLARIDVGIGFIELYHTHLYSGGTGLIGDPDDNQAPIIRLAQVDELIAFYRANHKPENVALVTGDFNINGRSADRFSELSSRFVGIEIGNKPRPLHDWWHVQRGDVWEDRDSGGYTNLSGTDDKVDRLNQRMKENCPIASPTHDCPRPEAFCHDPTPSGRDGQRIDYIWVERPTEEHTFNLDLTRIRRVPFQRESGTTGGMEFLSDHMGLDVTLIVSPRTT